MTGRSVDFGDLTIATKKVRADLTNAITSIAVARDEAQVNELVLISVDATSRLLRSGLISTDASLTWRQEPWQVAATSTEWGQDNTLTHQITCRSPLARRLRNTYKASVEKKVSPSEWVTARVAAAGGVALCQPSSKQGIIAQSSGDQRQSELDVIASLASDQEWTWVERSGRLWFGSRHWAWSGGLTGQKDWPVTWLTNDRSDALAVQLEEDDDDVEDRATGTVTVPYAYGSRIQVWDRLLLSGFADRDGWWLVTQVPFTADLISDVTLSVARPHPPAAKAGSST